MAQVDDAARRHAEEIGELHRETERDVPQHQLRLERITSAIASTWTFYALLIFAAGWISANLLLPRAGLREFDPHPFPLLELLATMGSLLIVLLVLLKQERQAKADQERSRLVLQITMLTDRRSAKLIQLFERLRKDLGLPDRKDSEEKELRKAPDLKHQREELQRTLSQEPDKDTDQTP